ncbi:MAG: hypothetical protein APF84_04970 [Gracilibacter sp. BRH_c7a]|nr:MAG: hypothetical protein APF84_04970 [Gracilibacter sp. BRH_c7a]
MKKEVIIGIFIALLIVVILAPLASSNPDGLERVAEDLAFLERADGREVISSPLPDYEVPGLENKTLAGILAGITGTLLTFALMMILAKLIATSKKNKQMS